MEIIDNSKLNIVKFSEIENGCLFKRADNGRVYIKRCNSVHNTIYMAMKLGVNDGDDFKDDDKVIPVKRITLEY